MNPITVAIYESKGLNAAYEFEQRLRALNERVKAAYPDKPLPLYLLLDGRYPEHRNSAAFGYLTSGQPVVGIGDKLLPKLTPAQIVAVVAHEYGHYYLTQQQPDYWSYWYYPEKRINECRADHFASRFVDNPQDVVKAVQQTRPSDFSSRSNYHINYFVGQVLETFYLGGNSHPHDNSRTKALADRTRRSLATESIQFNSDCSISSITPPLPHLPTLPHPIVGPIPY